MPAQEFEAWFRLLTAPGMTRPMARRLLRALGSPQAVLGASASQWSAAASPAAAQALSTPDPQADARLQMALDWLALLRCAMASDHYDDGTSARIFGRSAVA